MSEVDVHTQAGKNFAWLSIAQFGTRFLGAAFFIFLSRMLLETGVGEYSFVASFVPFWFLIVDFGGASYLFREWSQGQKTRGEIENDFQQLFTMRLVLVLLVAVPFFAANYFINRQIYGSLILFYVSMYLAMFTNLLDLYFQSQNLYRFLATRQIIEKTVAVVAGVILLLIRPTVPMVFVAILASQLASIAYYYIAASPFAIKIVLQKEYAKRLFLKGLPFLFIGIFSTLYGKIDVTMLRYMGNFQAVGLYGAAYKFMDFSSLFPALFISAVFPVLSPLWGDAQKRSEFNDFFQQCFRIMFSAGLLMALFLIVGAPLLIQIFFPGSFSPSILALRILAIAQIVAFLSMLFNSLLIIENREKIGLVIIVAGAVFNIVLNFVLIPKFSLYGSAWATVIAELLNLYLLQRYTRLKISTGNILKITLLSVFDLLVLLFMRQAGTLNNLWLGAALFGFNVIMLFATRLAQKQDIAMFARPFKAKLQGFGLLSDPEK